MFKADAISIVTVSFRSMDVLPKMIASIPAGTEIVVVDNAADADLRRWAGEAGIRVVDAGSNVGFGAACNLGAAATAAPLILFLNPDCELCPGALAALADAATRHIGAAAFGACLLDGAGGRSYKRRTRFSPRESAPVAVPDTDTEVPALSGAALMVRRTAFDAVGGFDPGIFLYYEDDDLSLRLRRTVGPLVFVPAAEVRHLSGKSTAPSSRTFRFKGYHWQRSQIRVARKFGLPRPALSAALSVAWALLRPKTWTSAERRNMALGRLDALLGRPAPA